MRGYLNSNPDLAKLFAEYIGDNRKHSFDLKDGTECLGWLGLECEANGENFDYDADYVWFMRAPSPFDAPDVEAQLSDEEYFLGIKMQMADINLDTLHYWDYATQKGRQVFDSAAFLQNRDTRQ